MTASHPPARSHGHDFGLDAVQPGERRTLAVVVITATFMAAEIGGGLLFGSMALLADGLHMASHAVALGVSLAAYIYARHRAHDRRFSFGVGKVNALAGFSSALLLVVFALGMAAGSVDRLFEPRPITYAAALPIAIVGLFVNLVCVWILAGSGHEHGHGHSHAHPHGHGHDHGHAHEQAHEQAHGQVPAADPHHDHNLRSAYLHVLADALTSVLAIGALLGAQHLGWTWLDPVMGLLGSVLVARWSWQLLRTTSRVLLDHQVAGEDLAAVRTALVGQGPDEITDLHVWEIGPGLRAACVTVESPAAQDPDRYRHRLPAGLQIAHATIEVRGNRGGAAT